MPSSFLSDGLQPPDVALRIIESFFHRSPRHLYLGEISLHVGWSLARTQQMIDVLIDRGVVGEMSLSAKIDLRAPEDALIFVLVVPRSLSKAWK